MQSIDLARYQDASAIIWSFDLGPPSGCILRLGVSDGSSYLEINCKRLHWLRCPSAFRARTLTVDSIDGRCIVADRDGYLRIDCEEVHLAEHPGPLDATDPFDHDPIGLEAAIASFRKNRPDHVVEFVPAPFWSLQRSPTNTRAIQGHPISDADVTPLVDLDQARSILDAWTGAFATVQSFCGSPHLTTQLELTARHSAQRLRIVVPVGRELEGPLQWTVHRLEIVQLRAASRWFAFRDLEAGFWLLGGSFRMFIEECVFQVPSWG